MKSLILAAVLVAGLASTASAQYLVAPYTTYYAPGAPVVAPAYYAAPVVVRPRRAYYAPAAVVAPVATTSYYAPAAPVYSSYYAPAPVVAPVAPVYAPVVVGRYGRSIYGTRQVYYPGQPVLNTWRAITP